MIRIRKHNIVPASLSKQTSWKDEDVVDQLRIDQYGKCYLCERIQITDFQVEHHKSRDNYPELMFEWSNLFWCCSYCNEKKSSLFDNMLNPVEENVEELVSQSFDFPNAKAVFADTGTPSESVDTTITLLGRIFNGTRGIRKIREQQFYDYAISRITLFQDKVLSWLESKSVETEKAIIEELDMKSEFLGFKYWLIKSNDTLYNSFGKYIKWHKQ